MNETEKAAAKAQTRAKLAAQRQMPAREYLLNMLHATRSWSDAEAMIAEVEQDAAEHEQQQRAADHRTWQHDLATLRAAQDDNKRLRDENAALQKRLHDACMARVWRNEDGKKFVFAEDIYPALLGVEPKKP